MQIGSGPSALESVTNVYNPTISNGIFHVNVQMSGGRHFPIAITKLQDAHILQVYAHVYDKITSPTGLPESAKLDFEQLEVALRRHIGTQYIGKAKYQLVQKSFPGVVLPSSRTYNTTILSLKTTAPRLGTTRLQSSLLATARRTTPSSSTIASVQHSRPSWPAPAQAPPHQEPEWEVEAILGDKEEQGTTKYLVKWANNVGEPQWLPQENLSGCSLLLEQYKQQKRTMVAATSDDADRVSFTQRSVGKSLTPSQTAPSSPHDLPSATQNDATTSAAGNPPTARPMQVPSFTVSPSPAQATTIQFDRYMPYWTLWSFSPPEPLAEAHFLPQEPYTAGTAELVNADLRPIGRVTLFNAVTCRDLVKVLATADKICAFRVEVYHTLSGFDPFVALLATSNKAAMAQYENGLLFLVSSQSLQKTTPHPSHMPSIPNTVLTALYVGGRHRLSIDHVRKRLRYDKARNPPLLVPEHRNNAIAEANDRFIGNTFSWDFGPIDRAVPGWRCTVIGSCFQSECLRQYLIRRRWAVMPMLSDLCAPSPVPKAVFVSEQGLYELNAIPNIQQVLADQEITFVLFDHGHFVDILPSNTALITITAHALLECQSPQQLLADTLRYVETQDPGFTYCRNDGYRWHDNPQEDTGDDRAQVKETPPHIHPQNLDVDLVFATHRVVVHADVADTLQALTELRPAPTGTSDASRESPVDKARSALFWLWYHEAEGRLWKMSRDVSIQDPLLGHEHNCATSLARLGKLLVRHFRQLIVVTSSHEQLPPGDEEDETPVPQTRTGQWLRFQRICGNVRVLPWDKVPWLSTHAQQ
ncbi:hypothetical protein RI367_004340 [Sorochytrium milnesiophthora]